MATGTFHTLSLFLYLPTLKSGTLSLFPLACFLAPLTISPSILVSTSFSRLTVLILPLENTNIYSNELLYARLDPKLKQFGLCQIIVSCRLNPNSLNISACWKEDPLSLPFDVESATIQTNTPPFFVIRYNSLAVLQNSNLYPL